MKKLKEVKLSDIINGALAAGKDVWRKHVTVMHALESIPELADSDIKLLDDKVASFKKDGGLILFDEKENTWTCAYKRVFIKIVFDQRGKKKYSVMEDRTVGHTPKEVITRIGDIVYAHHQISKRLFVKQLITEVISYLDDDATKDSIEAIIDTYQGNAAVLFNAINDHGGIFDISIDAFLEDRK